MKQRFQTALLALLVGLLIGMTAGWVARSPSTSTSPLPELVGSDSAQGEPDENGGSSRDSRSGREDVRENLLKKPAPIQPLDKPFQSNTSTPQSRSELDLLDQLAESVELPDAVTGDASWQVTAVDGQGQPLAGVSVKIRVMPEDDSFLPEHLRTPDESWRDQNLPARERIKARLESTLRGELRSQLFEYSALSDAQGSANFEQIAAGKVRLLGAECQGYRYSGYSGEIEKGEGTLTMLPTYPVEIIVDPASLQGLENVSITASLVPGRLALPSKPVYSNIYRILLQPSDLPIVEMLAAKYTFTGVAQFTNSQGQTLSAKIPDTDFVVDPDAPTRRIELAFEFACEIDASINAPEGWTVTGNLIAELIDPPEGELKLQTGVPGYERPWRHEITSAFSRTIEVGKPGLYRFTLSVDGEKLEQEVRLEPGMNPLVFEMPDAFSMHTVIVRTDFNGKPWSGEPRFSWRYLPKDGSTPESESAAARKLENGLWEITSPWRHGKAITRVTLSVSLADIGNQSFLLEAPPNTELYVSLSEPIACTIIVPAANALLGDSCYFYLEGDKSGSYMGKELRYDEEGGHYVSEEVSLQPGTYSIRLGRAGVIGNLSWPDISISETGQRISLDLPAFTSLRIDCVHNVLPELIAVKSLQEGRWYARKHLTGGNLPIDLAQVQPGSYRLEISWGEGIEPTQLDFEVAGPTSITIPPPE